MKPMASSPCVILVPSSRVYDPATESALAELSRRRYPVWRIKGEAPPDIFDRMAADALAAGFNELCFIDPSIVFEPDDVERLRGSGMPITCGVYPLPGHLALSCQFHPGVKHVRFGRYGVRCHVESADLGFSVIHREALAAINPGTGEARPYFAPPPDILGPVRPDAGLWFCERARNAGFRIVADTSIRLWKVGPFRHGWEDAGSVPVRHEDYTFFPPPSAVPVEILRAEDDIVPACPAPRPSPTRSPLRPSIARLADGFPKLKAYIVTYPANRDSLDLTLASFRATDWGEDPTIVDQPADWQPGGESAPANYKRALEAAAQEGCDFALILEDDTRFNRNLRRNILTLPIVQRDQCDYLSLFVPDLLADPWERCEPELGYRLAKPRYGGPDRLWEKHRVWGVQAIVMSRRLVLAALERWDRLPGVQDARLLGTCGELGLPLFYSNPSWVDHAPLRSGYNTPLAYAPDFDESGRLAIPPAFHPPEEVPGWLTRHEAEVLWRMAAGRQVLEIGCGCGDKTVSLAQSASHVVAAHPSDSAELGEWLKRYGVADRVTILNEGEPEGDYGMVVLNARTCLGLERDLATASMRMQRGCLLAVHHYPDPAWPDVRSTIDAWAKEHGWRRIAQADFLGIFERSR
jgi:hypothetical protein